MTRIAVFPGTFDPITIGHVDLIQRFLPLFDKVIVAIGVNSKKKTLFTLDQRKAWIKEVFKDDSKVEVDHFEGLTVEFCKKYAKRVCFDISHSQLACNYFGWSMRHFVKSVGPFTAHLHIVDAKGDHDEGLQIGVGDIDFEALGEDLRKYSPEISFIPEIWQGHKNSGEGFWIALDKLEQRLAGRER